jgi:hypothetical protein
MSACLTGLFEIVPQLLAGGALLNLQRNDVTQFFLDLS